MNKKLFIIPILLLIAIIIVIIKSLPDNKFYLEDNYYGKSKIIEIDKDKLENLIDDKESFALFIYQPACVTSSNFEKVIKEFLEENSITIYMIAFSSIKETSLGENVKYYPSFAIYNKGKLIDNLEADKNDDLKYFESKKGFKEWFTSYVLLKESNVKSKVAYTNEIKREKTNSNKDYNNSKLKDIKKEDDKVNIYLFYGSTCPHCKAEIAFLDEIKNEYGALFNLYTFEVWENLDNKNIMNKFAKALGDEAYGVPYTIIGNKSIEGFGEDSKEKFINAIKNSYKNKEDIYFDKIINS